MLMKVRLNFNIKMQACSLSHGCSGSHSKMEEISTLWRGTRSFSPFPSGFLFLVNLVCYVYLVKLSARPNLGNFYQKFWSFLPKICHDDNWNWSHDQFLVNFTKIWLRWRLELVAWPIFGKFLSKFGQVTNSNCHHDEILVNFIKNWSPNQFLVKFTKNKKPDRKGLTDLLINMVSTSQILMKVGPNF